MQAEVVIGANYGDEGKGLFTEYLCRNRPKSLVVLSNGGCQRGHTVNNKDKGIRHVFHHFGSGTLLGVPSVFTKTYLLNPIKFVDEKRQLNKHGICPRCFRVTSGIIQLPGDMFINQALENHRRTSRCNHGSCGWGIWETMLRNKQKMLTFDEFLSYSFSKQRKTIIDSLDKQIQDRLVHENAVVDNDEYKCIISLGFIGHFIDDLHDMAKHTELLEVDNLLNVDWGRHGIDVETFVVENAQGLLLDKKYASIDENGRTDVHTTPSRCGVEGALEALGNSDGLSSITANYISRTYLTRHGAGPFPEQNESLMFKDETNIPNGYQGSLRFGSFDDEAYDKLKQRIEADAQDGMKMSRCCIDRKLIATHMNEIEDIRFKENADFLSYEDSSKMIKENRR